MKRPTTFYFYHTRLTTESLNEWKEGKFPGHLLYGLPLLEEHGFKTVLHPYRYFPKRWQLMLYATRQVLGCYRRFDALYATSFRGLELIILLRALGLFRKPIVLWHHTAMRINRSKWRERCSKFFYRGIDELFFFSSKHIEESLRTGKCRKEQLHLVHWGPDLPFYDGILKEMREAIDAEKKHTISAEKEHSVAGKIETEAEKEHPCNEPACTFISTGKENRDLRTLLEAFQSTHAPLEVYISESCGTQNYKQIIEGRTLPEETHVHFTEGVIPYQLAQLVAQHQCIVICCLEFAYTVGLTTLVEALALGLPVICSRNPYFEFDVEKEGIGLYVDYGDVEGWKKAINYLQTHPEKRESMGRRARVLAEKRYNLTLFSAEIAETLHKVTSKK